MESASPRGYDQSPEIKACIPLEAQPYSELELDCVDPGDGAEGGYHHRRGEIDAIGFGVIRIRGCGCHLPCAVKLFSRYQLRAHAEVIDQGELGPGLRMISCERGQARECMKVSICDAITLIKSSLRRTLATSVSICTLLATSSHHPTPRGCVALHTRGSVTTTSDIVVSETSHLIRRVLRKCLRIPVFPPNGLYH